MKKVLVLVDCQNDFIDGSLGVGYDKWMKAYKVIKKQLEDDSYDMVCFTLDHHPKDHCSFIENGGKWPSHCIATTDGEKLYSGLDDLASEIVDSIFYFEKGEDKTKEEYGIDIYNRLKNYFSEDKMKNESFEFYFVGLCFDYCVAECAKMTAEHSNCKCYIIKDGTVAIDENAIPDVGNAIITRVTSHKQANFNINKK